VRCPSLARVSAAPPLPTGRLAHGLAAVGLCVAAALWTVIAYLAGPLVATALVVALAGSVLVLVRPVAGIAAAIFSVPLEPLNIRLGAAGLSSAEAILLASAASVLLEWLRGRELWRGGALAISGWFALVAASSLGVFVADDPVTVVKIVVVWAALGVLAVRVAGGTPQEVRTVAAAIGLSAVVLALIALAGAGDIELRNGGAVVDNRATGAFNQPNLLAFYLVLALPVCLVPVVRWRGLRRLAAGAGAALVLVGLLLTLSRGPILGAVAALLALCAWPGFRRLAATVIALVLVFSALNLEAIRESPEVTVLQTRLSSIRAERGTNPRLRILRNAPAMVVDHPVLGVGQGGFSAAAPFYNLRDRGGDVFDHAHNLPLTIAAETGLVGLSALVVLLIGLVRAGATVLAARASALYPYGVAAVASFTGLAVLSLLDYPLRSNPVLAVIALQLGVLVAAARHARQRVGA
jgi:putative inorganic carbon (hco3(-)) transporter